MTFAGINYLAVVIAALAGFGFGAVYYMSLASPWLDAIGKTRADLDPSKTPFLIAIAANLVMAWVLAGLIAHMGPVTIRSGIISAAFCWFGFVITTLAVNYAFGQPQADAHRDRRRPLARGAPDHGRGDRRFRQLRRPRRRRTKVAACAPCRVCLAFA